MMNTRVKNTIHLRQMLRVLAIILVIVPSVSRPPLVRAALQQQEEDPVTQCAEGVNLYLAGEYDKALPLLETGIINRENGNFANAYDLGICAFLLGYTYDNYEEEIIAIEVYKLALQAFRDSGDREMECLTLNNLSKVYSSQNLYSEALEYYQQALGIAREIGGLEIEGTILNGIGVVYKALELHDNALEYYEQALVVRREVGDRSGEGITLNQIGIVYYSQGNYSEALEYYQLALSIKREIGDQQGEGTTLNNIGNVYLDQGRYSEALEYFQQALVIRRDIGDQEGEGGTLNDIGLVYESLGDYNDALKYYQQALVIRRKFSDRQGEGETLNNIGKVYLGQGNFGEALKHFHVVLKIAQEVNSQRLESFALANIGSVYSSQGRYLEAVEYYQQDLKISEEIGDRHGIGTTLHNIGSVYLAQGYNIEALEQFQKALATRREIGDRKGEGTTLDSIGSVYHSQGRYAEALDHYQQALTIIQKVGDQASEVTSLNNIGTVYRSLGRYSEALDYYQQALSISVNISQVAEGAILHNIGDLYDSQGFYIEALEYYRQALAIAIELGDRQGEGITLNNIGKVYLSQGHYVEALDHLHQALSIAQEIRNRESEGVTLINIGDVFLFQERFTEALEQFQQALSIAQEVGDRQGEATALNNIGNVYEFQGRFTDAMKYYEDAMSVYESLRAMAGSETSRSSFISQYHSLYDRAIRLYYQQSQLEQAFITTERGRARSFLDSLATGYVELSDSTAAVLYAQEHDAYDARQAAQDVLVKARVQNPRDDELIVELEEQLTQAETRLQAALDAIAARGDQLTQLIPGRSTVLDIPRAQALLDGQTTLISFWMSDNQTLAFVLTKTKFNIIALPISRTDLFNQIEDLRNFVNIDIPYRDSAVGLYGALITPLKPYLTNPHLVIVPHSELHYLPFAALTDGKRYLVDDYTINYLPSVSTLAYIQQNIMNTTGSALILGNPTTSNDELAPLTFAESETRSIASLYKISPLLGSDATETTVHTGVAKVSTLHLAAHGVYNSDNPLYSTIYLAPDGKNDGMLEVHEIYGLDLSRTDLVVLSACETQLGKLSDGDEMVGLTRAFFFAGTPSVIASLWPVDDQATQLFMEHFYTSMLSGMGKAEALRQAQIDLRTEYPNPYYWAGFVLNGGGGNVDEFDVNAQESTPASTPMPLMSPTPVSIPSPTQNIILIILGVGGFVLVMTIIIARWLKKR